MYGKLGILTRPKQAAPPRDVPRKSPLKATKPETNGWVLGKKSRGFVTVRVSISKCIGGENAPKGY